MKTTITLILILLLSSVAYAACRTYTIMNPDGTMRFCTECCHGGHCNVTCN